MKSHSLAAIVGVTPLAIVPLTNLSRCSSSNDLIFLCDEILFYLAYDKETINSYGFLCHILKKHEKAVYHAIASVLLSNAVNYLPYVYHLALFHQRRAVELEPTNVGYKEYLLYFNDIPEKVLSDKEAIKIAKEILVLDPKNEVASRVIKRTS